MDRPGDDQMTHHGECRGLGPKCGSLDGLRRDGARLCTCSRSRAHGRWEGALRAQAPGLGNRAAEGLRGECGGHGEGHDADLRGVGPSLHGVGPSLRGVGPHLHGGNSGSLVPHRMGDVSRAQANGQVRCPHGASNRARARGEARDSATPRCSQAAHRNGEASRAICNHGTYDRGEGHGS